MTEPENQTDVIDPARPLRKVEVDRNGAWLQVLMKDLKVGELFRIYDLDESLIDDDHGNTVFRVEREPFQTNGVWAVEAYAPGFK